MTDYSEVVLSKHASDGDFEGVDRTLSSLAHVQVPPSPTRYRQHDGSDTGSFIAIPDPGRDPEWRDQLSYDSSLMPPPPPPPPPPQLDPESHNAFAKDKACKTQEELQDAREELLGLRYALRARRRELATLRLKASSVGGSVFDQLRCLMQGTGIEFPRKLIDDYQELSLLHDQLGFSEVVYDQDEEMYNAMTFRYTQKEVNFVDSMLPKLTGNALLNTIDPAMDANTLTSFADGPDDHKKTGTPGKRWTKALSGYPSKIATSDLTSENLAAYNPLPPSSSSLYARTIDSLPSMLPSSTIQPSGPVPSIAYSENELSQMDLLRTLKRVDSWILETIRCSSLQRAILKQYFIAERLEDPEWWEFVESHWEGGTSDLDRTVDFTVIDESSWATVNMPNVSRESDSSAGTIRNVGQMKMQSLDQTQTLDKPVDALQTSERNSIENLPVKTQTSNVPTITVVDPSDVKEELVENSNIRTVAKEASKPSHTQPLYLKPLEWPEFRRTRAISESGVGKNGTSPESLSRICSQDSAYLEPRELRRYSCGKRPSSLYVFSAPLSPPQSRSPSPSENRTWASSILPRLRRRSQSAHIRHGSH